MKCDLLPRGTASLSVERQMPPPGFVNSSYTVSEDLFVDNKKIFLISKNVYNITNLTYYDSGVYGCQISETIDDRTRLTLSKNQVVTVLKKGKTHEV